MESITPFDWHRMFIGNEIDYLYMLEIVFRVIFIYLFTIVLIRFMGKRGNRSLSMFENVLIIALGSASGDVMFYPKVPLMYACIVITVVVCITRLFQELQLRSKRINSFLDGAPIMMIKNGELVAGNLDKSRIRKNEFLALLRTNGIKNLNEVEFAFFETTGGLSIFKYDKNKKGNTVASTFPDIHEENVNSTFLD